MVYDFYEKYDEKHPFNFEIKKHAFNFLFKTNMEYILILLNDFNIEITHIISLIFLFIIVKID